MTDLTPVGRAPATRDTHAQQSGGSLARLPQCPNGHGQMILRTPPGGSTSEQQWCGTWYDCPPGLIQCKSSALVPSADLVRSLSATHRSGT